MEHFEENEFSGRGPDIKEYFYLLRSWAWLIALVGLAVGVAAYAASIRMAPMYEASTRILVIAPSTSSGIDSTSLVTTQSITSTYAQMLLDRPVLQGVIHQLQLSTTPEELEKSVSVRVVLNTQLLTISVKDRIPGRAADIANAIASVFTARIRELQSQRYAATREGLAKQVTDMGQQVEITSAQIAEIGQQIAVASTQTALSVDQGKPVAPSPAVAPEAATLEQLQARLTQYRTIYADLVTSYEQVRLAEEQTSMNVVVSEPAAVPTTPLSPGPIINALIAAAIGMLLATAVISIMHTADDTIKNPEDFRKKFGLPILGMIVRHKSRDERPVVLAEPHSLAAEAFRSLRTSLTYAALDKPLRRILIASPTLQDGKTTVACSLAVTLSQSEKRVVLLDADLREPQVHRKFGLENRFGLSDLLVLPAGNVSSALQSIGLSKLTVLPAGGIPPNPAELLSSHAMSQILDALNDAFDLIVIDTPPLLTVTDAAALAPATDGVILVVKPGTTKLHAFQRALEQLQGAGVRVLGVVLNEVNPSSRKYGYYYNEYFPKNWRDFNRGRLGSRRAKVGRWDMKPESVAAAVPGATLISPDAIEPEPELAAAPQSEPILAQPEPVASDPEPIAIEPEAMAVKPEVAAAEPVASDPEPIAIEPEAVAMQPEVAASEPVASDPEPIAIEPEAVAMEPEVAAPEPEPVAHELEEATAPSDGGGRKEHNEGVAPLPSLGARKAGRRRKHHGARAADTVDGG